MIRGLYIAASGMITKQLEQENLSNNIANINTAGYKKDKVMLKSFKEMMIENKDKIVGGKPVTNKLGTMEFGVGVDDTKTIFTQGNQVDTGRNLDFMIQGDGFFTVLDNKGQKIYTRDGRFRLDKDGYLTTSEGYKVLGLDSKNNISPIKISNKDFAIDNKGKIATVNGQVGFLVCNFQKQSDIVKDDNNCYKAIGQAKTMENPNVLQNSYEGSNVDSIEIITDMISVMRSYESNQKVMAALDETLGKTVNDVGSLK